MTGQRLPRELRQATNRMAHEYASAAGLAYLRGALYSEEQARLQALAVTWLAAGSTTAEALEKLQGGPDSAATKMRETLKTLRQRVREMQ